MKLRIGFLVACAATLALVQASHAQQTTKKKTKPVVVNCVQAPCNETPQRAIIKKPDLGKRLPAPVSSKPKQP